SHSPRPGRLAGEQRSNPLEAVGRYKKHLFIGGGAVVLVWFLLFGPINWESALSSPAGEADRLIGEVEKVAPGPKDPPPTSRFTEQGIVVAAQSIGWKVSDRSDRVEVGTVSYRMYALHKGNTVVDLTIHQAHTSEAADDLVDSTNPTDHAIRFDYYVARVSARGGVTNDDPARLANFLTRYRDGVLEIAEEQN
ncbi:MAG: hypothetical protein ACNA8W_14845, partial [Bradymonadaceae bacterium]